MSYGHLTARERYVIHHLSIFGLSNREIGRRLCRHHTTIGRELKRNGTIFGPYLYELGEKLAQERRHKARHSKRRSHRALVDQVLAWLQQDWSPEIIVACLKQHYPRNQQMRISVETIYQWIYRDAFEGGSLYQHLWHRRRRRKRQRGGLKRYLIPNRTGIEQRPAGATSRSRYGHWEGDTVEGKKGSGGLATHVERKSRFLLAGLLKDKCAETFSTVTQQCMGWVPESLRRSNTLDNGTENAQHETITKKLNMPIYFADPYSPWQRGTNEQTNGLLRRYFPKGTDFRKVTQEEVDEVVETINRRPRKCLGYRTPYDVFADAVRGALAT
jgi:IS30 family transposase